MSSCIKALNIGIIADEVIWLSQAGSCELKYCRNPFFSLYLHYDLDCRGTHLCSLWRCILVCKLWARLGISQLWGSYTTDKNLLALILSDKPSTRLWSAGDCRGPAIGAELIPHPYLDRWNFYAKSVQTLTIDGSRYRPETFQELAHMSDRPILPSLKAVVAIGSWLARISAPSILATVLSQSVHDLEIVIPDKGESRKITEAIRLHAPGLRYLGLRGFKFKPVVCDLVSELLLSLRSLQVLCLDTKFVDITSTFRDFLSYPQYRVLNFQLRMRQGVYGPLSPATHPSREIGTKLPSLTSLLLNVVSDTCCRFGDFIGKTFGRSHHLRLLSVVHDAFYVHGVVEECVSRYCEALGLAFPHLEIFCFDTVSRCITPLKIEVVNSLLQSTQLTQLSLIGFKVTNISEFTRFLTFWPNLTKLEITGSRMLGLWFVITDDDELAEQFAINDIAEGEMEGVEGIGLNCLTAINTYLPNLKTLRLTLVASPTEHLELAPLPFKNLETLDFTHSFYNFRLLDFNHEKAARFVNSFMASRTSFIFREDESLEIDLWHAGQCDDPENIPWMEYSKDYNQFCKQFQEKVDLAYGARLDGRE